GRLFFQEPRQFRHAPDPLADGDSIPIVNGKPRAVVTAVFQPVQPLHQHIDRVALSFSDVADDSAHDLTPSKKRLPNANWYRARTDPNRAVPQRQREIRRAAVHDRSENGRGSPVWLDRNAVTVQAGASGERSME